MHHDSKIRRVRIVYRGVVQGVGFRPFIYRSAVSCGLSGHVQNRRSEVIAELEGTSEALDHFESEVAAHLPGPARIDSARLEEMSPQGKDGFAILESRSSAYTLPPIPPDLALCSNCRRELLDPTNRRYLYPFITCTECGPRYSIVEDTPFDRERTSMVDFLQCGECRAEFEDPLNRRFHSQTNSCSSCGPTIRLETWRGEPVAGDPLVRAIEELARGRVLAVQGIGGFHLAADPCSPDAVARLRRAKERERKPFAIMGADIDEVRRLCTVSEKEQSLLESAVSPIVILPALENAPGHLRAVSDIGTLGVMLPYTPLHYLLFYHPGVEIPYRHLIMTSGNHGNEPIIADPEEARATLGEIAELFLVHDRRILFPTDDSIVRFSRPAPIILRRSRGYVPGTLRLKEGLAEPTVAAGSDLKSAPALAVADGVVIAPHVGDLAEPSGREAYERAIRRMLALYSVAPKRVVHDLHPSYFSSAWAKTSDIPVKASVQHHYAHVLSVMAEHGLAESLGVAFDGTGYGTDGTIWGGEFLHATRDGFSRLGSFRPFALPGGEAAIRHPQRIVYSLLHGFQDGPDAGSLFDLPEAESKLLSQMIDSAVNSPLTSSVGRLFDAAAALLGLVREVSYEGEGPMKLETLAATAVAGGPSSAERGLESAGNLLPFEPGLGSAESFRIDARPLLAYLAGQAKSSSDAARALLFHQAIAASVLTGAIRMREQTGLNALALSGGVFQNSLLLDLVVAPLMEAGFTVYLNRSIPPGDGGLAVGQLWYRGDE